MSSVVQRHSAPAFLSVALASCLLLFCCILLEWAALLTQHSFLYRYQLVQKVELLLFVPAPLLIELWCGLGVIVIIRGLLGTERWRLFTCVSVLIPAGLLWIFTLSAFDTGFYSAFGYSLDAAIGWKHVAISIAAVGLFIYCYYSASALIDICSLLGPRVQAAAVTALTTVPLLSSIALNLLTPNISLDGSIVSGGELAVENGMTAKQRPNIVIFSSDGVAAKHMSAYGYSRETTPFLDSVRDQATVFENAFPNSGSTTGTLLSVMTGKLPTTSKMIYYPDLATGRDAFEHLPGLLRQLGYFTVDMGIRFASNSYDYNLQDAFDEALFTRSDQIYPSFTGLVFKKELTLERYFLKLTFEKVCSRIKHLFGVENARNYFNEFTDPEIARASDDQKLARLRQLLSKKTPVFALIHLTGTHGPHFAPRKLVYSKDSDAAVGFNEERYDDAILSFDQQIKELFDFLREKKIENNTIVIVTSDHGPKWVVERVPLMIFGAKDATPAAGKTLETVQLIDIPPTILHLIGVPIPNWMEGRSLYSNGQTEEVVTVTEARFNNAVSPYYSLGSLGLIICNTLYSVKLEGEGLDSRQIREGPGDCMDPRGEREIRDFLHEHLRSRGWFSSIAPDRLVH